MKDCHDCGEPFQPEDPYERICKCCRETRAQTDRLLKEWEEELRLARAADKQEIERLKGALERIHGNYQPACVFCKSHREWSRAALAPPPAAPKEA